MKTKFTITLFAILFTTQIEAQNYKIDSGHSSVQIQVERFGVVDVVGRFKDVQGNVSFNSEDISQTTANAIIKVESYDANNIGGEKAVKSPAFLDVETYPEISFKSSKTEIRDGENYLIGDLTIHGVTKEIALPFTIKGPLLDLPTQKQSIAFNASFTINRQDYGISFDRKFKEISLVSNNVNITLKILAIAE